MFIYYLLLFIWFVIYVLNRGDSLQNYYATEYKISPCRTRKNAVILSSIVLVIIMGLRATSVGTDTASYAKEYMSCASYHLSDFVFSIEGEIGFIFLEWIFAKMGVSWQLFLFLCSTFVAWSMGRFIYRYSVNPFWGFYLYLTIGMFAMNMTGVRQSFAVAILLFAYEMVLEKKIILFSVLCLIAISMHYTSIVFVSILIVILIPFKSKKQMILGVLLPVSVRVFVGPIYNILSKFALRKYMFSGYFDTLNQTLNPLVEVVAFLILGACFVCLYFIQEKINEREYHMFMLTGIYVACIEMSHAVFMAMRLSFYFIFFMTCLLGNVIYSFKDKRIRGIVYMFVLIFPFLQFLLTIPGSSYGIEQYMFFWNK